MSAFQKWFLWATSAVTGASGLVLWWMDTMLEPVSEWAVVNHPLQPWVLKLHVLAAPLLVFAVGLIAAGHIWKHFRAPVRRARRSGVTTMLVLAPMVVSGYLIQVVTLPWALRALVWAHIASGIAYLAGLVWHRVVLGPGGAVRSGRRGGQTHEERAGIARGASSAPGAAPRRASARRGAGAARG